MKNDIHFVHQQSFWVLAFFKPNHNVFNSISSWKAELENSLRMLGHWTYAAVGILFL